MIFKNISEAKEAYLNGHKAAKNASNLGDYKSNDKIILEQINPAFDYLKKKSVLNTLCEFLEQNEDIDLKQSIAVALLPYYEEIALNALEQISNMDNSLDSFKAKMVIKQWKKGLY